MTCAPWRIPVDPCVRVHLQDLTMVGRDSGDPTELGLLGWDGWSNGGETSGGGVGWEIADGGVKADVRFSSRTITLTCDYDSADHEDLMDMAERVSKVLTVDRHDWLTVDEDHLGLSRMIQVYRAQPPLVSVTGSSLLATLTLRTVGYQRLDAVEQAVVIRPGETVDVVNAGDYPADLTVNYQGQLSNLSLSWSGASTGAWQYADPIPAGQSRVVEYTGRVVYNPVTGVHSRVRASGAWVQLWPGTTRVTLGGTGTGSARLIWRSAWT